MQVSRALSRLNWIDDCGRRNFRIKKVVEKNMNSIKFLFRLAIAIFFLISLFIANFSSVNNFSKSEKHITLNQTKRLNREDLPVKVSDKTWNIFEDIQEIQNLAIEFDPNRKNGTVSENVRAQYLLLPSKLQIGIVFYDKNITEEVLAHEALHVLYICQGHPFFYRNAFRITKAIENMESSIQHIHVYKILEMMGFNPKPEAQNNYLRGIEIFRKSLHKIPQHVREYELITLGAEFTLRGLVNGVDLPYIKENIPPRIKGGLTKGIEIYKELNKYNFSEKEENFKARIFVATALGLTVRDTLIGELDFRQRKRFYYDPNDGSLFMYLE